MADLASAVAIVLALAGMRMAVATALAATHLAKLSGEDSDSLCSAEAHLAGLCGDDGGALGLGGGPCAGLGGEDGGGQSHRPLWGGREKPQLGGGPRASLCGGEDRDGLVDCAQASLCGWDGGQPQHWRLHLRQSWQEGTTVSWALAAHLVPRFTTEGFFIT